MLRCQEKQMLKMADLIKTALNEVGCEELPSGCDDISVDPSFIENNISNNDQQPVSDTTLLSNYYYSHSLKLGSFGFLFFDKCIYHVLNII